MKGKGIGQEPVKTVVVTGGETPPVARDENVQGAKEKRVETGTKDAVGQVTRWEQEFTPDAGGERPVQKHKPMRSGGAWNRAMQGVRNTAVAVAVGLSLFAATGADNAAYAQQMVERPGVVQTVGGETVRALSAPMHVQRGTDVVARWAGSGLYVQGNVGLSDAKLAQLNQWLRDNHPHATVLLAESFRGESYTDIEGRTHRGIDAVENALGRGLVAQTEFGGLVDARTGQPDGQILVISLTGDGNRPNSAGYFAAEAFDARGLGEANWMQGRTLFNNVRDAMRQGGNLEAAVKNTFTAIDQALDSAIQAEQAQAAAALANARTAVTNAGSSLTLLEQKVAAFTRSHPGVAGDIARPNINQLRAELGQAQSALERGDVAQAQRLGQSIEARSTGMVRAIDQYDGAAAQFQTLQQRIDQLSERERASSAKDELDKARAELERAQNEHRLGNASYAQHADQATNAVNAAERTIDAADSSARLGNFLLALMGLVGLLGTAGAGFVANRRRTGKKDEAEEELATWEKGLKEKLAALAELQNKTEDVLGDTRSPEKIAEMYKDETLALCLQLIDDIDRLFIGHKSAEAALGQAGALINPSNPLKSAINLFSKGNYEEALAILKDQPIIISTDQLDKTDREKLMGNREAYAPVRSTFEQLIADFNQRAERATNALDAIKSGSRNVLDTIDSVQGILDEARGKERELAAGAGAGGDGLFLAPTLFTKLIPAAQKQIDEGRAAGGRDPVGALRTHISAARENAEDAISLAEVLSDVRKTTLPAIRESQKALDAAGIKTGWVDDKLRELSARAEALAVEAIHGTAVPGIRELQGQIEAFAARMATAAALDKERREVGEKAIADATALVDATRMNLGRELGVRPEAVLTEDNANPTKSLDAAREQVAATKAALDRGGVDSAEKSLGAARNHTREARAMVEAAKTSFAEHKETAKERGGETGRLNGLVADRSARLDAMAQRYADSVFKLGAGDVSHPNANGTVRDNIDEAKEHLESARKKLVEADDAFKSGRLIGAADLLRQIAAHQELAGHRFDEIVKKEERLAAAEKSNAQVLRALDAEVARLQPLVDDAKTMNPTVQAYAAAKQAVATAKAAVEAKKGDPFAAAAKLETAKKELAHVDDMQRCDRDVYNEAVRSLQAAESQLRSLDALVAKSRSDNVADSPEIKQAQRAAETLRTELARATPGANQKHGDWNALDREADRITSEGARAAASLEGELEQGQRAVSAISDAASSVRTASSWTGSYGVSIYGSPGANELANARSLLEQGNYDGAIRAAQNAERTADSEVRDAEAKVARKRREEQERIEAERRRRQQEEDDRRRASSSSSSSSWSSSSGTSSGSFSSSSGFSSGSW